MSRGVEAEGVGRKGGRAANLDHFKKGRRLRRTWEGEIDGLREKKAHQKRGAD